MFGASRRTCGSANRITPLLQSLRFGFLFSSSLRSGLVSLAHLSALHMGLPVRTYGAPSSTRPEVASVDDPRMADAPPPFSPTRELVYAFFIEYSRHPGPDCLTLRGLRAASASASLGRSPRPVATLARAVAPTLGSELSPWTASRAASLHSDPTPGSRELLTAHAHLALAVTPRRNHNSAPWC